MKTIKTVVVTVLLTLIALVLAVVLYARSGAYNVAADEPHWWGTRWLLETTVENSIEQHAKAVEVPPNFSDRERVNRGASAYDQMCAGCHLAPGMESTVIREGLKPTPPRLSEEADHPPEQLFWVIKHGIKMTGMPAWGESHSDQELWDLVALIRELPQLSPGEFRDLVSQEGHTHDQGHSH